MPFAKELLTIDVDPNKYLSIAKKNAKNYGLDPDLLTFSDNKKHKLCYGKKCFGSSIYPDYIIYRLVENKKYADHKRYKYLARATNIKGNWKDNKTSPNNLSIHILWDFN